jgi:hypothetical protein
MEHYASRALTFPGSENKEIMAGLRSASVLVRLPTQSWGGLLGRRFRRGSSSGSTVEPSELASPALLPRGGFS